jgi:SNF2 family DNA or RNA helicase
MRQVLTLREPQHPMVDFLLAHERCSLWAGMGIGKSSAALFAELALQLMGRIGTSPTLVVGPMRVARDTWPDEVAKWELFEDMKITPLVGCPEAERIRRLRQRSDIFTIDYELLPWLVEYYLDRWPFQQVVADESDRLKGFRMKKKAKPDEDGVGNAKGGASAKRAYAIGRLAHTLVKRWVNLTGTPAPEGYLDLWGQMWFVDRGQRLGLTYSAYQDRWFRTLRNGKTELMPHSKPEIDALLKDVCLTVDPKDYFDLHEPIVTPVIVHLPKAARKIYRELEKKLFADLGNGVEIEVFNSRALSNKCLQIANGAVYTDYPAWQAVHDEKIEALQSIAAESSGVPLLVAYSFKSDVVRIKKAFPRAVELSDPKGMAAFKAGDSPMGLAHEKSMGHGVDGLQHVTNILVRFGHRWPHGERVQMLERIGPMRQFQGGYDRPVFVYDIIADNTLDEEVIESHTTKCGTQQALMNAMKRRG